MSATKKRGRRNRGNIVVIDRAVLILLGVAAGVLLVATAIMVINQQQQNSPAPGFVPEVSGAPRVSVSEEVVDYGDVPLNTTIETVFRVRNVGDEPLQILGEPQVELVQGC